MVAVPGLAVGAAAEPAAVRPPRVARFDDPAQSEPDHLDLAGVSGASPLDVEIAYGSHRDGRPRCRVGGVGRKRYDSIAAPAASTASVSSALVMTGGVSTRLSVHGSQPSSNRTITTAGGWSAPARIRAIAKLSRGYRCAAPAAHDDEERPQSEAARGKQRRVRSFRNDRLLGSAFPGRLAAV